MHILIHFASVKKYGNIYYITVLLNAYCIRKKYGNIHLNNCIIKLFWKENGNQSNYMYCKYVFYCTCI